MVSWQLLLAVDWSAADFMARFVALLTVIESGLAVNVPSYLLSE